MAIAPLPKTGPFEKVARVEFEPPALFWTAWSYQNLNRFGLYSVTRAGVVSMITTQITARDAHLPIWQGRRGGRDYQLRLLNSAGGAGLFEAPAGSGSWERVRDDLDGALDAALNAAAIYTVLDGGSQTVHLTRIDKRGNIAHRAYSHPYLSSVQGKMAANDRRVAWAATQAAGGEILVIKDADSLADVATVTIAPVGWVTMQGTVSATPEGFYCKVSSGLTASLAFISNEGVITWTAPYLPALVPLEGPPGSYRVWDTFCGVGDSFFIFQYQLIHPNSSAPLENRLTMACYPRDMATGAIDVGAMRFRVLVDMGDARTTSPHITPGYRDAMTYSPWTVQELVAAGERSS